MSGMWGSKLKISIFGESHGDAIGITIDGLPSGITIDMQKIKAEMIRRAPNGELYSTMRKEEDEVQIVSGFFNGKTTGAPLCGLILNENTQSKDYNRTKDIMRPSHSDYGYFVKSGGNNDYRGGGHSSGRITAPLVFCGAICKQLLAVKGIQINSHILSIADIEDKRFDTNISAEVLEQLSNKTFPLLDSSKESDMIEKIVDARYVGDSVGGRIECAIVGVEAGVGDPFFDSIESKLSSILFSVPAVKAVEFGNGFE
ncbi:MAG: chorismate synthase, partial [Clostridia bacterium]